jgi:hypothetical protein
MLERNTLLKRFASGATLAHGKELVFGTIGAAVAST